jgi:hypothetical protein
VESVYDWETVFPGRRKKRLRDKMLLLESARNAWLAAGPAGRAAAAAAPYAVPPRPVSVADPHAAAIRERDTLAARAGLPGGLLTTTAAARIVADLQDRDLQLVGPGLSA